MLSIKNITKNYGKNVGNFNISFNVNNGEVLGILGPNGAGKTTLIRQIMGFVKSDSGSIDINGLNPWIHSKELMNIIGYVAGEISLYENFTGKKLIDMSLSFKKNIDRDFLERLIKHFDIDINRKIKKMSKGMKQKIALILSVIHKPKILILDEPTSGLDPVMQDQFNKLVSNLKKGGTTIIICSHIFEEVAKICDKVIFIKEGKLVEEFFIKNNDLSNIEKRFKTLYESENYL